MLHSGMTLCDMDDKVTIPCQDVREQCFQNWKFSVETMEKNTRIQSSQSNEEMEELLDAMMFSRLESAQDLIEQMRASASVMSGHELTTEELV